MTTFLFTYRKPTDAAAPTPERIAAWYAWFESMGEAVVEQGNPTYESTTVGSVDGTEIGGYSLVEAPSLEDAVALAKGSPVIDMGGGVEVGVITSASEIAAGHRT